MEGFTTIQEAVLGAYETLPMVRVLWEKLLIFLDYPEVQLDTNLVENDIRPFVVGRKNWLFSVVREALLQVQGSIL